MAHLFNPLATATQLYKNSSNDSAFAAILTELHDSIRYYTSRLTQAAGILLQLPQDITAQANVLLFRYWLIDDLMLYEYSDVSAAIIYLTAKVSASPRSLRSITNVYAYLLSLPSLLSPGASSPPDPELYYLSEGDYHTSRNRILHLEGQILNALSFNTHVALPHSLAVTYLQTLDVFSLKSSGKDVANRAIEYLNTALLSPQMLYLTHQPCALATAAIYLAARDKGVKLPECEWWEVFDCEREELGFLAVAMGSLEGLVRKAGEIWGVGKGMITRDDIRAELKRRGVVVGNGMRNSFVVNEEDEMARLMDEKIEAV